MRVARDSIFMLPYLAIVDPITIDTAREAAEFLSTKDLKWWFAALFILFVLTGVFILRLLLNYHQQHLEGMTAQLTEQRTANASLHEKMMVYITTDHQAGIKAQTDTAAALEKLASVIEKLRT